MSGDRCSHPLHLRHVFATRGSTDISWCSHCGALSSFGSGWETPAHVPPPSKALRFKPGTWALGRSGSPVRIDSLHEGGCDYNVSLWQDRPATRALQPGGSTSYNDAELRRISDPLMVLRVLYTEAFEQVTKHGSIVEKHDADLQKYGAALHAIEQATRLAAEDAETDAIVAGMGQDGPA